MKKLFSKCINSLYSRNSIKLVAIAAIIMVQFIWFVMYRGGIELYTGWQSIEMTFDYKEYGFIKRGLIGTVARSVADIFGTNYDASFISKFEFVSTIIFVITFILFIKTLLDVVDKERSMYIFIICLVFVSIGGVSFYFIDWAELDIYMIILTFASLTCIIKDRFIYLVPINCALSIMIHEGYPLMFFMIVMAILFYKWLENSEVKFNKYFIVMMLSGIITSILFIYFYFFSNVKSEITLEYMNNRAINLTGIEQKINLCYIFFGGDHPSNASWINGKPTAALLDRIIHVIVNIFVYLPILTNIILIKKSTYKKCENAFDKIKYKLIFSGFVFIIILLLIQTDINRWVNDYWFYMFSISSLLIVFDDHKFVESFSKCIGNTPFISCLIPYFVLSLAVNKHTINVLTDYVSILISHGILKIINYFV